jgi:hypothetical protein
MDSNNHSVAIPAEVVQTVNQKLNEINQLLEQYSTPLTSQERHDLLSMGEKTLSFVQKALEFAEANPNLCPNYLDMTAFQIDMSDATGLRVIRNSSKQTFELLDDVVLLAGSEAYHAALTFYNYIKLLAAQDISGAKAVYEDLKKKFPRRQKKSNSGGDSNGVE